MEKASRESVVTTDVAHLIAALKAAKNKAVMDIVSATKFQVAEFNMNGPIAFANRLLRFSIFSLTVQSDHPNARHPSATLFHDGGTLILYVEQLGFQADPTNLAKIQDMVGFYDVKFHDGLLIVVESGKKSLRDIRNAAAAVADYFENLATKQGAFRSNGRMTVEPANKRTPAA